MASKTISTILKLKDNMSSGVVRVSKKVNDMSKEAQKASKQVASMANGFKQKVDEMSAKALKWSAVTTGVLGGLAAKSGFSEAFDMEGYRVQLETATKDTEKAGQLMSDAVKFANKTPFETGEIVQATAKMEMYGLSSKRWLADVADMAGSTNKSIDQATEAMADVAVGEFERIKEFGLKKDMILAESNKKYGEGVVFNAKGQVVDQEKLMDVVQQMMQDKFKGGAEKLANTTKGLWSTITGITKSSLAKIVGMQEDGTIKQGSLLDKVKSKVKEVGDAFTKWQEDGTVQKIADTVTNVFGSVFDVISKVINFVIEHEKLITTIGAIFLGFAVGIQVAKALAAVMTVLQIVWALFNGTLALTPLGWVVLAITAIIAVGYALWRNWDWVCQKAGELWAWLGEVWNGIKSITVEVWTDIVDTLTTFWNGLSDGFSNVWNGIKSTFSDVFRGIITGINEVIRGMNSLMSFKLPDFMGGGTFGLSIPEIPAFAKGTQYTSAGLAQINEKGGELRKLSSGESIIPADQTQKLLQGNELGDIKVFVTVQGNVIGNEEFMEETGDYIANKVKLALQR